MKAQALHAGPHPICITDMVKHQLGALCNLKAANASILNRADWCEIRPPHFLHALVPLRRLRPGREFSRQWFGNL